MRTTVALDDDLVAKATSLTGLKERSALLREALTALVQRETALVQRETAKRLALLGGTEPDLTVTPRRRANPA